MRNIYFLLIILTQTVSAFSQQYGTGLIFAKEEDYKNIPLASTPMMGMLPSQKDLSSYFPPAGNQGNQLSCVGWAVAYGLKSYQEAIERKQKPTNDQYVFSPSYIYNQIKVGDCYSGSIIENALNLLRKEGVAKLSDFPYSQFFCTTIPDINTKIKARSFTIADWRRVDIKNQVEVKSQIASGFPIVIGMYVDEGFQSLKGSEVYSYSYGKEIGGHSMVVVGYDDSKQAYKLFNSWGTSWGENGFGWISYSLFESRVKEAYTAQDVVVVDPDEIHENNPKFTLSDLNITTPVQNITTNAWLGQPIISHNITLQTNFGIYPGMIITVPGSISNAQGNQIQLVLRFYFTDGRPLIANTSEPVYRDANGLAATGTVVLPVVNNPEFTNNIQIQIPYYALNLQPTNGTMQYSLATVATLYINSFEKAKSPFTPMIVRF